MTQNDRMSSMSPSSDSTSSIITAPPTGTMQQSTAQEGMKAAAQEGIKTVASDAADQAKSVAGEVKTQVHQFTRQTTDELRQQAETRSVQAAQGLRSMADQISALSEGRPEEAGPLVRYLGDGQARLQSFADRLEQSGPQGLMNEVSGFARRRPGAFLLYAAGAGFLAGRLIRANQGNGNSQSAGSTNSGSQYRTSSPELQYSTAGSLPLATDAWTAQPGVLMDESSMTAEPTWRS